MITITAQKPFEEVTQYLNQCNRVYIIGCGTCATMLHTGGKAEVVLFEGVTPGAMDYSAVVQKIRREDADAVIAAFIAGNPYP